MKVDKNSIMVMLGGANYPGKLRIFKTHASRYWQVRCYLKGRPYTVGHAKLIF